MSNSSISPSFSNQFDWNTNITSCGRPPTELGLLIVCALANNQPTIGDIGLALDTYASCCPQNANGTNLWMARQECTAFCYTSDTVLAEDFSSCAMRIGAGVGNDTSMYGDCGYIDYKTLGSTSGAGKLEMGSSRLAVKIGCLSLILMALSSW